LPATTSIHHVKWWWTDSCPRWIFVPATTVHEEYQINQVIAHLLAAIFCWCMYPFQVNNDGRTTIAKVAFQRKKYGHTADSASYWRLTDWWIPPPPSCWESSSYGKKIESQVCKLTRVATYRNYDIRAFR
jgi:hypothetical protein